MDAQRIADDAIVALTGCDREAAAAFIRKFYLAGVRDPKRLTFKGLQALSRRLGVIEVMTSALTELIDAQREIRLEALIAPFCQARSRLKRILTSGSDVGS